MQHLSPRIKRRAASTPQIQQSSQAKGQDLMPSQSKHRKTVAITMTVKHQALSIDQIPETTFHTPAHKCEAKITNEATYEREARD